MLPILFTESTTVFTSNGVGRLSDAVSCIVTEERNGQYDLTLEYPITGVHFASIAIRSIIGVIPAPGKTLQAFRVNNISRPLNGIVTINAEHISYELTKNVIMPFSVSASASACNTVLQKFKTDAVETCPFTFWTDVNTVASYQQTTPATIRQRLGGVSGSVLDQYGGEFEFDNYTVKLYKKRGVSSGVTLLYGKNIIDLKQEEEISKTVTGIVPYWVDSDGGILVTLPEKAVYSSHASDYSTPLTQPYDFSGEFQDEPTQAQLRTAANDLVSQPDFGVPKVSIEVSFVNLKDTEEYKDISALQQVHLCDTVIVKFEKLGIDTTAKIVKVEFDVLKERYNKISVGSTRSTLSTQTVETSYYIQSMAERVRMNFAQMDETIESEIRNATAWLTSSGGYVIAIKNTDGSWKELLFMDTDDISTAVNVLRINQNGIGFSSNGVNGPYTQAWTLDGRLVIGGTNVPSLTVYDNQNNIIFQTDATKIIWNATNSSMSANGTITAKNGVFTNCQIKSTDSGTNDFVQINSGSIEFGNTSTAGASIAGDTNSVLIDASDQSYVFDANTRFGVQSNGNIDIFAHSGHIDIQTDSSSNGDLSITSAKELTFAAARDISFTSSAGDFSISSPNGVNIVSGDNIEFGLSSNNDEINLANRLILKGSANESGLDLNMGNHDILGHYDDSINESFIRFSTLINNDDGNIELNGPNGVFFDTDNLYLSASHGSSTIYKGYTGAITVSQPLGGSTTLHFINGILV